MAAAATLKSATLENQLLEVVELMAVKQGGGIATNPNAETVITSYNRNNLTGQYTISISLSSVDTINTTTGTLEILADPVFV
jgi:hypothetical protein